MVYTVGQEGTRGKVARKDRSDLSFARESITFGNSPQLLGLISLAVKSIKCIPVFILHGCFEKKEWESIEKIKSYRG